VKLRGRTQPPDQSRGCTLSSRTRGDTIEHHGPLQRLLDATKPPPRTSLGRFADQRTQLLQCPPEFHKTPRVALAWQSSGQHLGQEKAQVGKRHHDLLVHK
jgi:hypothetical protein